MIKKKSVDILWISIRNIELRCSTIRDSYIPQSRSISWRLIHHITHMKITSWFYDNCGTAFIISNEARDPRIQIIFAFSYTINGEASGFICFCPELITLAFCLP
uniref:Uncharacterized protein n=1 Tax=Opuntia streptacantha TaxID=393608 RepID=A0A7C9AI94_OPUST